MSQSGGRGTATLTEFDAIKRQLLANPVGMREADRRERVQLDQLPDQLQSTYLSIVETLAFMVEMKDKDTRDHLERCRGYALALALELDPTLATPQLEYGFLLHDIGKIVIPESILRKPGPLTIEEAAIMRTHPVAGVRIVAPLNFLTRPALDVIRHHHERFDGEGYPDRLAGEEIPVAARMFSVVDAFDAMTTNRPYRSALSTEEALDRLGDAAGYQFDPEVVEAFSCLVQRPVFEFQGVAC
ncbi:MAG: HD-GYP domain-containing protein [Actinomycetota bacterium]